MEEMNLSQNTSEVAKMSALKIKYDCGLGDNGRSIIKTRNFSNVKHDAKAIDIYNVAEILTNLQKHDILSVEKIDNVELTAAN